MYRQYYFKMSTIFFSWRSFCKPKIGLASSNLLLNLKKKSLKKYNNKKKKILQQIDYVQLT